MDFSANQVCFIPFSPNASLIRFIVPELNVFNNFIKKSSINVSLYC
jgi:hypothetical protein